MMTAMRLATSLCVAAVFSVGALASESPVLERIVASGKIRIGMSGDQAPFNVKNKAGELIGFEVDLANFVADALGVEVEFVTKAFPDLLGALKDGEVDIVMSGMTITAARSLDAVFVGPYIVSGKSVLAKSRALAGGETAEDFNRSNITVAALRNSTSEAFVQKRIPKATLVTVEHYDEAIQMIIKDEIDALVADMPACNLAVFRHPDEDLATLSAPLTVEPIGIAVSSSELPLQMLLDNYVSAFEASGLLEMLRVQWLEKGDWVDSLP